MGRPRRQAPSRDRLEDEAGEERARPSPVKHAAKSLIMLLVPGCIEPETASTVVNQQLDPRSCVNPGTVGPGLASSQLRRYRLARALTEPAMKQAHAQGPMIPEAY